MPRLPPTPHSMEANEPCLGRWVHDDASGLEGLVIEVKTGGWRVVLAVDGNSVMVALDIAHQDTTGRQPSDVGRDPLVETFRSRTRYGHHAAPTRNVERGRR